MMKNYLENFGDLNPHPLGNGVVAGVALPKPRVTIQDG